MHMKNNVHRLVVPALAVFCLAHPAPGAAAKIDFEKDIKGILEAACLSCHGSAKPKGELVLETRQSTLKGGENGAVLVPGSPEQSPLYTSTILAKDHEDFMPPKGDPLTHKQSELLKQWILEGALWPEQIILKTVKRVNFVQDIQPILEASCVSCHHEGHDKGDLRLDVREAALKGGGNGPAIMPGHADQSPLYTSVTLPADHDDLMPPANKGGPLPKDQIELLRSWIDQGAFWPDGLVLQQRKSVLPSATNEPELVARIHGTLVSNLTVRTVPEMRPYTNTIPGSRVSFEMVPIPPGEFVMGSPDKEAGRKPDEGPQHKVKIEPFWMGKCEVSWNEFELFMYPTEERKIREFLGYKAEEGSAADAVTRPTAPYVEMSFGMGKDGYPAISMTHHAASKYCQWLSAKTGQFYRLPTEAEWEYACRAGTTTVYSFGDNPGALGEYAWYGKNSNWKYQKVGKKKPNPWGLYDMHGNVLEWCLDQYDQEYYKQFKEGAASNIWNPSAKPYPHVARGGSWDDDPESLRSAARRGSEPAWKMQDPQLPKSIWYHTDAQFLGFRVVRPLAVPPPEQLFKVWNSGVERE